MQSGRLIAKETGARCCMMYASTPGDLETATGKEAQRMIDKTPRFSERFYDLTEEEIDHLFDGMVDEEGGENSLLAEAYIDGSLSLYASGFSSTRLACNLITLSPFLLISIPVISLMY